MNKRWPLLALIALGAALALFRPDAAFAPAGAPRPAPPKEATLRFVGDLMFDRYIGAKLEAYGPAHVLGDVADFLADADLTVGNLEGPVTQNESVSRHTLVGDPSNMRFTFATSVPGMLRAYGVDVVSIGNNHILDFGRPGAEATKSLLSEAGVAFVGDPLREAPDIVVRSAGGIPVAFVAYNDFMGLDPEDARQAIRVARANEPFGIVAVLAHWGVEYAAEPPDRVRALGRSFIDAGASLVVGTHPHVVEPHEEYHDGRIYYSLGNFVFDQYWDSAVSCGEAITAHIVKGDGPARISYAETAIGMDADGRTRLGCGQEGDAPAPSNSRQTELMQ